MIPHLPVPPDWHLQFDTIDYDWVRRLRGCPQEPEWHGEGDVYVHTQLVMQRIIDQPLSDTKKSLLLLGALLHDVGKPDCTRHQDGRWTSRGHARRGALLARRLLWELDVPFAEREAICGLVEAHLVPFRLLDREDPARIVYAISHKASCADLATLAEADATGRIANDVPRLVENVHLFAEFCRDAACLDEAKAFASDHSRFCYFRTPGRDPDYAAYDDTRCEVVLMSGLPGVGKNRYIEQHLSGWPIVSLDDLREQLDVAPTDAQGPVVAAAREAARVHLRAARPFVWNATNLSRDVRRRCIDLFADYGARVRIVYVEAPLSRLERQNSERPRSVPWDVIERLFDRWEIPDRTEAHVVEYVT